MSKIKKIATLNITQVAELKGVSRQAVYNNLGKLDRTAEGRIIWNDKLDQWEPDLNKGRSKISA